MDLNKVYAEMAENLGMAQPEEPTPVQKPIAYNSSNPKRLAFRNKVVQESNVYQEECAKHLLLDIYMRILPMDKDYIDSNRAQCMDDITKFLASKGMTALQYFNSAASATGAPMMESIIDNLKAFGTGFVEKAMEDADEAANGGTEIEAPETKEEDVSEQIVDITSDMEYEDFVDVLKKKTIDKIVNDISALIVDEKENNEMVFDPKTEEKSEEEANEELLKESALAVSLDYMIESCIKAGIEMPDNQDEVMGMAIRESTLNMIDQAFAQPGSDIAQFTTRMRLDNGSIVTESNLFNLLLKNKESIYVDIASVETLRSWFRGKITDGKTNGLIIYPTAETIAKWKLDKLKMDPSKCKNSLVQIVVNNETHDIVNYREIIYGELSSTLKKLFDEKGGAIKITA